MVIITQQAPSETVLQKLKKILPVALIAAAGATIIQYYTNLKNLLPQAVEGSAFVFKAADTSMAQEAMMTETVQQSIEVTRVATADQYLIWTFVGITFLTIFTYLVVEIIKEKRK